MPDPRHTADTITDDALDALYQRVQQAEAERDAVYRERAHLLAYLAALHPATAVIAPADDVQEPGWQLLYLLVSGWQMSWHIAPGDANLMTRVVHVPVDDPRAQWDGHTTDEKYQRIRAVIAEDRPMIDIPAAEPLPANESGVSGDCAAELRDGAARLRQPATALDIGPVLALAVADWLTATAGWADRVTAASGITPDSSHERMRPAIVVARATAVPSRGPTG